MVDDLSVSISTKNKTKYAQVTAHVSMDVYIAGTFLELSLNCKGYF